jgi:ABC-type phosphate transport system substrate-binding protein
VIVFVTHLQNKIRSISVSSMEKMLAGEHSYWSDVNPRWDANKIHVFVRPGSGTTSIILKAFTGSDEFRPHFFNCQSNSVCLNSALSTPGSIYWVSSAWLYTQPLSYLRPFFIRHRRFELPQNPFQDDFEPENYHPKMIRPLYMYVLSGGSIDPVSSDLAQKFFEYVRGVQGQEMLEKYHFYTYFAPPTDVTVVLPEGFGARPNERPVVCK